MSFTAICYLFLRPHRPLPLSPEQYESFVKFTQDQIMRRYGTRPASCKHPPKPSLYTLSCWLLVSQKQQHFVLFVFQMSPERCAEEIPASSHNKAVLLLAPLPLDFHMTPQFVFYPAMSNCSGAMTLLLLF